MNIYLAGSFSHKAYIRRLAEKIRFYEHAVYCFCDEHEETNELSVKVRTDGLAKTFTAQSALQNSTVKRIGNLNWEQLSAAEIVIVALPCGKSAHLEAGWAKGKDKLIYVYGFLTPGDWDAMYVMADGVYDEHEFGEMMDAISVLK